MMGVCLLRNRARFSHKSLNGGRSMGFSCQHDKTKFCRQEKNHLNFTNFIVALYDEYPSLIMPLTLSFSGASCDLISGFVPVPTK